MIGYFKILDSIKKKVPIEIRHTALLFVISRTILTIIGVTSRILLEPFHGKYYVWVYSKHLWLDIWGVWDSGWYMSVANLWYPKNVDLHLESNYGFFPLYPLFMRIFNAFIHNYFISGIVVSNIALFVACIFLYKVVSLDYDKETALRSIKYLYFFPTAFIFSGVFSESLYLALSLISIYYAKINKWFLSALFGCLAVLTRSIGIIILLPLVWIYFKNREFKLKQIKIDVAYLLLLPLALCSFFLYTKYLSGDWLAYVHAQAYGWGVALSNPVKNIFDGLRSYQKIDIFFPASFTVVMLILLTIFSRKIGTAYSLFAFCLILAPLSCFKIGVFHFMLRYSLPVFPFYLILAQLSKNYSVDLILMVLLMGLQAFLMVFWSNGFAMIT